MENYDAMMTHLNVRLQFIEALSGDTLEGFSKSIQECQDTLKQIRNLKNARPINGQLEEIEFYKKIKVPTLSKLLYFVKMYNIEVKRPYGSNKTLMRYYKREIANLQTYLNENHQFYRYYRSGSTHLDNLYFTQNNSDLKLYPESVLYYAESEFSTSHDAILAMLIANENVIFQLQTEIETLKGNRENQTKDRVKQLQWQANKNDLVELIYALHATGAIGPSTISLKNLTYAFADLFNVELGNISRTFLELIGRSNQTKFMDSLKCNLQSKMQKVDEKRVN